MDRIREKLNSLRAECDAAVARAEDSEAKVKELEHSNLKAEQQIASLEHQVQVLEGQLEDTETKLTSHKQVAEEGEASRGHAESLSVKVAQLEAELDTAETNLREVTEKSVIPTPAFDACPARTDSNRTAGFASLTCALRVSSASSHRLSRSVKPGSTSTKRPRPSTSPASRSLTRLCSRWKASEPRAQDCPWA